MKAKILIPLVASLFLVGCGDNIPEQITNLEPGDKVVLTSENVTVFLNIHLSYSYEMDSENCITKMNFFLETSGYDQLSYFEVKFDLRAAYSYLSDSGDMLEAGHVITVATNKVGYSTKASSLSCNYRSVSNVHIDDYNCSGFVVKK